jgi:hypothetical protein
VKPTRYTVDLIPGREVNITEVTGMPDTDAGGNYIHEEDGSIKSVAVWLAETSFGNGRGSTPQQALSNLRDNMAAMLDRIDATLRDECEACNGDAERKTNGRHELF